MSPTGVAVLLLLALCVDYMSIGPNSIRDRLAFLMALAAIRQGFDGSPIDKWTVQQLSALLDELKTSTGSEYIAGATTSTLLGGFVGVLAIFTVGCLLPVQASKKLGRFASLTWPQSPVYRLNLPLWLAAALLGMLAELPGGAVGATLLAAIDFVTGWVSLIPAWLFGVS
jgi:hypothetical protein